VYPKFPPLVGVPSPTKRNYNLNYVSYVEKTCEKIRVSSETTLRWGFKRSIGVIITLPSRAYMT
jgi:hypothetical protein